MKLYYSVEAYRRPNELDGGTCTNVVYRVVIYDEDGNLQQTVAEHLNSKDEADMAIDLDVQKGMVRIADFAYLRSLSYDRIVEI